ncbi:MAG: single-stranded DNA-binding protein [Firmicutes bacterium]|nr:single-stranded DNA-binding protein [Bacillota bacterium]
MNKVELTGRLTANPELKEIADSDKVYTRFSIAVQRNFKNKDGEYDADFFNVVAWNKQAETICNHVKKGHRFGVVGRLQNKTYEKQDGSTGYITDVILEDFDFLEPKSKEDIPEPDYPEAMDENDPFADFGDQIELSDNDLPF